MRAPFSFWKPAGGVLNPATLAATGWWRDHYNAGTGVWTGEASAGTSGGVNLTNFNAKPTTGTAMNGQPTAHFDGTTTDMTSGLAASSFLSASAWTVHAVVNPSSITANNANAYQNHCIIRDGSDFWGLLLKIGPLVQAHNNDGITDKTVAQTMSAAGSPQLLTARLLGGVLSVRFRKGPWVNLASGNLTSVAGTLYVGSIANGAGFNGDLAELMTLATGQIDADCDAYADYAIARYAL